MLFRSHLGFIMLTSPGLMAFAPLQQEAGGFQIEWWYWLVLFLVGIPLLMALFIRAAWGNAPAPPATIEVEEEETPAPAARQRGEKPSGPGTPALTPVAESEPEAPVAPDSIPQPDLIEITDDMSPDEVRRARIANAKAEAAYKKALKEAGVEPGAAPAATSMSPQAASPAEPTTAPVEEPVAVPAKVTPNIPEPDLIEITDDMSPDQVRQARIHNARAQAAYKKALKEAGVESA